jgi:hypothetical protein
MKIRAIARAQHFRDLMYKNQGISQRTAAHIYKMLCRAINEYDYLLFYNVSNSTKKKIEVTETTFLRRIIKLRHPRNSLFNPSNVLLYQYTSIKWIIQRWDKLAQKFSSKPSNLEILTPMTVNFPEDCPRKRQHPTTHLNEAIFNQ